MPIELEEVKHEPEQQIPSQIQDLEIEDQDVVEVNYDPTKKSNVKRSEEISIIENRDEFSKGDKEHPVVAKIPENLMFEITNACNLRCPMCYNKDMKRKLGYMDIEFYTKVIKEAKELGIRSVGLYTTGEAFLHPKVFDFIKIAKNEGIDYVYITSNGILLNEKRYQKIFDSGLDSIKFSIDAGSKKTYDIVREGGNWEILLRNIRRLREMRDEKKAKLRIFGGFVITKDNYHDLINYKKVFESLIDETAFGFVGNQASQRVDESKSMMPEKLKSSLENLYLPLDKVNPCNYLWNRFVVTYDGNLTACCMDFEAKLIYADLNESTLKESWNNEKMKGYRTNHIERMFHKMPLCQTCDLLKRDPVVLKKLVSEATL